MTLAVSTSTQLTITVSTVLHVVFINITAAVSRAARSSTQAVQATVSHYKQQLLHCVTSARAKS
jgi:hypothetical protein